VNATVVGGGLAGCEAAWALAERGVDVTLYEMRPHTKTPAHQTDDLAEIVCSNTFKSLELANAHGLLKAELRLLGSLLMQVAETAQIPGGAALTVDRAVFSREVTRRIEGHPRITVAREEITHLPSPAVVATGPLTSDRLAEAVAARLGAASLAFYDAIAPIVSGESLDHSRLYRLSRYGKGGGDDYLNAALDRDGYEDFVSALISADQYAEHEFDTVPYFEGCLPLEEMARAGNAAVRPAQAGGVARPPHGTRAPRGATVAHGRCVGPDVTRAPRGATVAHGRCVGPDVEPGRLPDEAAHSRAEAHLAFPSRGASSG
jgi:methylenetetrahydrofolate--tRNA-(uracil-5-)-methyltransferase